MTEHGDWDPEATGRRCLEAAARAARDLKACGPRAVVLFGSAARLAAGAVPERPPRDLDLFLVGDTPPLAVEAGDYGVPLQLHRLRIRECVELARTLREPLARLAERCLPAWGDRERLDEVRAARKPVLKWTPEMAK